MNTKRCVFQVCVTILLPIELFELQYNHFIYIHGGYGFVFEINHIHL